MRGLDSSNAAVASAALADGRFVAPLVIHLCWFASCADQRCAAIARGLYAFFHRPHEDDPVLRPGLEIPVEYGRELAELMAALESDDPERREAPAALRVVVVLLDGGSFHDPAAKEVVQRAVDRWPPSGLRGAPGAVELFWPVVLDARWHAVVSPHGPSEATSSTSPADIATARRHPVTRGRPVPAISLPRWGLGCDLGILVGRALSSRPDGGPEVLVSAPGDGALIGTEAVLQLGSRAGFKVWCESDHADDVDADAFEKRLREAGRNAVVLVVRSPGYADCARGAAELLAAKRARAPLITILAAEDGERVTSAYGGNHPTVRWPVGHGIEPAWAWELAGRCVQAWLHTFHFTARARAALEHAGLPASADVIPRRPEMFDLVTLGPGGGRRLMIYPDPPIAEAEARLLRGAAPTLRIATPTTMISRALLARDPVPPLAGRTIALSVSSAGAPTIADHRLGDGHTEERLDDAWIAIALAALHGGAQIAYGGDHRYGGYADRLSRLHRSYRRLGIGIRRQLISYVDPRRERVAGAMIERGDIVVDDFPRSAQASDEVRRTIWRMTIRHRMATECHGRVVIAGQRAPQSGATGPGYKGPWSGILEETWRTLRASQALYLVGGFGGMAGVIARMLRDRRIPALLADPPAPAPGSPRAALMAEVDDVRRALADDPRWRAIAMVDDRGELITAARMAEDILRWWDEHRRDQEGHWRNHLGVADNERLLTATDPAEIAHLVFAGLRASSQPAVAGAAPGGAPVHEPPRVAFFLGDLVLAPNVDGYVVTSTPGFDSGGLAAVDAAMGGRLGQALLERGRPPPTPGKARVLVEEPVSTEALPGRHVIVAGLPFPDLTANRLDELEATARTDVRALARAVARRAAILGLQSVAITPFVTKRRVRLDVVIPAMLEGIVAGRGTDRTTWIFCEYDRQHHDELKQALARAWPSVRPPGAAELEELHAATPVPRTEDTAILRVEATPADGGFDVRSEAFATDGAAALVPACTVTVRAAVWRAFGERRPRFDLTVALGEALWDRVLHPDVQVALRALRDHVEVTAGGGTRRVGRRLMVMTDERASSLPWELLADPDSTEPPYAIDGGLVRRVHASQSARGLVSRGAADALLRVLIVADPTGDLASARAEGVELHQRLSVMRGVRARLLLGKAQARAPALERELVTGRWDVLHYAGHAYHDPDRRGRDGLQLADRLFTAADLERIVARHAPGGLGRCDVVPSLVVLSACNSAHLTRATRAPRRRSAAPATLASATPQTLAMQLLRAGVRTMLGTFFPVADDAARELSFELHAALAAGHTTGTAMIRARRKLRERRHIDWGSFLLYGDDTLIV